MRSSLLNERSYMVDRIRMPEDNVSPMVRDSIKKFSKEHKEKDDEETEEKKRL